jgi:hypothetical protein
MTAAIVASAHWARTPMRCAHAHGTVTMDAVMWGWGGADVRGVDVKWGTA